MKKLPTYSICNLMGANRCMTELMVTPLRDFWSSHQDLPFPHRHDFYQIVFFTRGDGTHSIDFQNFRVQTGQVYAMSPGQVHGWFFDDSTEGYIVNFHTSFLSSAFQQTDFLAEFPIFQSVSGQFVRNLEGQTRQDTQRIFEQMLAEFQQKADFRLEMLRSLLVQLLVQLSRLATPSVRTTTVTHHQMTVFRNFEKLVEQHFREKRLPKDYAEMLFLTPNHLNSLCTEVVGRSAGDIIRSRVLLEAKRLLANSDDLVGQIADNLHFQDNAYFTRFFKKYTDASPEQFRATFRVAVG